MENDIIFEFKILNLQIIPQLREFVDVVKKVNLLVIAKYYTAINNTTNSVNHIELIGLPDPDNEHTMIKDPNNPDYFIAYNQLTENEIIEWIKLSNPIIGHIKTLLTDKLINIVNSNELVDINLPWIN